MTQEVLEMMFHFCLAWSVDILLLATNVNLVYCRPLPNDVILYLEQNVGPRYACMHIAHQQLSY